MSVDRGGHRFLEMVHDFLPECTGVLVLEVIDEVLKARRVRDLVLEDAVQPVASTLVEFGIRMRNRVPGSIDLRWLHEFVESMRLEGDDRLFAPGLPLGVGLEFLRTLR